MADYPTLTEKPDVEGFSEGVLSDPTLRSETESGTVVTRLRFTKAKKTWTFRYYQLSDANKVTLKTFEDSTAKYGSVSFNWINPVNSVTYVVRLLEPIEYRLANNIAREWDVVVKVAEV